MVKIIPCNLSLFCKKSLMVIMLQWKKKQSYNIRLCWQLVSNKTWNFQRSLNIIVSLPLIKYHTHFAEISTVVFNCQRNIFYLKGPKKDTSDFPRKSEGFFFERKICQIFQNQENLWYLFFGKNSDFSRKYEKFSYHRFYWKIGEIFFSKKVYLKFPCEIWGIIFWTFQIKYISQAVKNHRTFGYSIQFNSILFIPSRVSQFKNMMR